MEPNCPWSGFQPASIHFCEENLCAWVAQPANAWSCMGFVLVGLWLWREARGGPSELRLFGPIAIAVGLTSFAYHASYAFAFQVLDLGSMYCLTALLIVLNLRRLGALAPGREAPAWLALVAVPTALVVAFKVVGIPLFALEIAAAAALERRAARAGAVDYRAFWTALGVFALSFGFWNLDKWGLWCDPTRHVLQGHAIWHSINALVFVALYRFYAQFAPATSRPAPA